jgi:hypothetical protein
MDFPNTEKTFYFDHTTEFGNRYEGNFTVKCLLTIGEKHKLELEKSRLLGNSQNPTDDLFGLSIILANLRAKIVNAPNWWTQSRGGESLREEELVATLFARVQDAEVEWKKDLLEKARLAKETKDTTSQSTQ